MAAVAAMLLLQPAQAQSLQPRDLCYGKVGAPIYTQPPEALISGCTAVIQSGHHSGHDLAVALTNRGLGYRATCRYELALQDFDRAIRLDPDYAPAYYQRANLAWERGDIERARQDFDRALWLNRQDAELADEEL